jgi:hypothetical protein
MTKHKNKYHLMPDDPIGSQMSAAELEKKLQELRPIMARLIKEHVEESKSDNKKRKKTQA